ncbi:hypothetical protein SeGA_0066 [Salmonella enterica subsp. enterica serovar Gaminara str. A4-567]|nr:hypothetical protein SeGA_0066 [Salmonella enterica subsp. enterica serovar Gaminara str. A4-567]
MISANRCSYMALWFNTNALLVSIFWLIGSRGAGKLTIDELFLFIRFSLLIQI